MRLAIAIKNEKTAVTEDFNEFDNAEQVAYVICKLEQWKNELLNIWGIMKEDEIVKIEEEI